MRECPPIRPSSRLEIVARTNQSPHRDRPSSDGDDGIQVPAACSFLPPLTLRLHRRRDASTLGIAQGGKPMKDAQGHTLTGATAEAAELFDRALRAFNLSCGDAVALLDTAREAAPDFTMAH